MSGSEPQEQPSTQTDSAPVANRKARAMLSGKPLTPKEREILHWAVAGKTVEDGFCLILAMMRHEKVQHTMPAAPLRHQPIACFARRGLNTGSWFITAPDQQLTIDTKTGQPPVCFSRLRP